jgi:hypothetical protein
MMSMSIRTNKEKHKHYDLIVAWAEGTEIEYLNESDGHWYLASTPVWHSNNEYRIRDPYRELKEAAQNPDKEIALIKYSDGSPVEKPSWESCVFWTFTNHPEYYAIRDKPITTKKVKMWQWICQHADKSFYLSTCFYSSKDHAEDNISLTVIKPALWSEIEVDAKEPNA